MPWTDDKRALAVGTGLVIGLVVVTPVLVGQFDWLFAGHVIFGLTIGLMVGMTQSPAVNGVMPLLFAFAGGSIVALSIGEERTLQQLETLGKQLAGFGIGTIIGLLIGVAFTKLNVKIPFKPQ